MLVAACVGYPIWPSTDNPGFISVDGIVWACLNLFFHGLAFTSLVSWDGLPAPRPPGLVHKPSAEQS